MSLLGFSLADELGAEEDTLDPVNNISKLLTAICSAGVQPVEDCLRQLLTQRSLDTAVGAQLDVIAKLVGLTRAGLDDDTLRRYCRAIISAHRSKGTIEDLLKVVDLVIFEDDAHYLVLPQPIATVQIRVEDIAITEDLAATTFTFLAKTAAAGVRVMLDFGVSDPTTWFRFDSGPGYDVGHFIGRIDH